jgi:nicotinamide mononucleotide (NMN) deamidase PncC
VHRGLLAARLTDVPGSSAYFERGFVRTATRQADLLGVAAQLIASGRGSPKSRARDGGGRAPLRGASIGVGITASPAPTAATRGEARRARLLAIAGRRRRPRAPRPLPGERERVASRPTQAALDE